MGSSPLPDLRRSEIFFKISFPEHNLKVRHSSFYYPKMWNKIFENMIFFYIYFLKIVFNSTKIENKFVKDHQTIIFMDTEINYRIGHIEYIQYKKLCIFCGMRVGKDRKAWA